MKTTFICLANSFKEKGRCIAGIEILNNSPVFIAEKPKWIRPVCETEHGQIPTSLVSKINLLDIVEIEAKEQVPDGFQSENILFDTSSIKVIGSFALGELSGLCESHTSSIFGNRGKAISEENADSLTYSLCMISAKEFEVYEKTYKDDEYNSQVRLKFQFKSIEYDLPITDPAFLNNHKANKKILIGKNEIYLILSLGIIHNGWHYKLVAGIL